MKNDQIYTNRPTIRCAYDRERVSFATVGPSLTDQSMSEECDVNRILERYQRTGVLEHLNRHEGSYGDFLDVPANYQDAINQVMAADDAFATLPATVRRRFGNSVSDFLLFCSDPDNLGEMQSLGLLRDGVDLIEPPSRSVGAPQGASASPSAPPPSGGD